MTASQELNILPNDVAKDPNAEVALVFVKFIDGLTKDDVSAMLGRVGGLISDLQHHDRKHPQVASMTLGFGQPFFARFPEHDHNVPAAFRESWDLHAPDLGADLVIHATVTHENVVPRLLNGLRAERQRIAWVRHERGARTVDDREVFGQRDGLRGVPRSQRNATVFISEDRQPEEPDWLTGGSYGAYIKLQQNMDAWEALDSDAHEHTIGRRESDGSRSDLPPGTHPHTEGAFADASTPSPSSHVRKAGPRGSLHDHTLILRRGMPYTNTEGGVVVNGLQFTSYQASPAQLDVVLNDWMFNPDFPTPGAGADALIGLVTFLQSALFVVPPHDGRFPGAGFFDPPKTGKRKSRIVVKKTIADATGAPVRRERGDFEFTFLNKATGAPLGPPVRTTSTGRAVSPSIKIGTEVTIHETPRPELFEAVEDITVTVTEVQITVPVTNRFLPTAPNIYG